MGALIPLFYLAEPLTVIHPSPGPTHDPDQHNGPANPLVTNERWGASWLGAPIDVARDSLRHAKSVAKGSRSFGSLAPPNDIGTPSFCTGPFGTTNRRTRKKQLH